MHVAATLDVRNLIRDRLRELNISAATFAALAGVSDTTFSDFTRGKRNLGNTRESEMVALLDKLLAYRDALRPFSLPLNDIVTTRRLMKRFAESDITPEVVRACIVMLVGTA